MARCANNHEVIEGQPFCGQCGAPVAATEAGRAGPGRRLPVWLVTAAVVAVAVMALVAVAVLTRDDDSSIATAVSAAPTTTTTSAGPTTTVASTTIPAPGLVLQPDGLGVATFGEIANTSVDAVSEVLGPPDEDIVEPSCPAGRTRFTTWVP